MRGALDFCAPVVIIRLPTACQVRRALRCRPQSGPPPFFPDVFFSGFPRTLQGVIRAGFMMRVFTCTCLLRRSAITALLLGASVRNHQPQVAAWSRNSSGLAPRASSVRCFLAAAPPRFSPCAHGADLWRDERLNLLGAAEWTLECNSRDVVAGQGSDARLGSTAYPWRSDR
jgi:hypothetical protein